ncbi:GNAT family N-acetyltransferase [bacterium]|nr:GNAT family N-acetyltransferase [bacterium]
MLQKITCRYFKEGENYHIGRVAIIKEYRGQGLGKKIMQIAENEIAQAGGQKIEVSAQVRVSEFYEKLGYKKIGDIYFDEYCEHIRMVKEL